MFWLAQALIILVNTSRSLMSRIVPDALPRQMWALAGGRLRSVKADTKLSQTR